MSIGAKPSLDESRPTPSPKPHKSSWRGFFGFPRTKPGIWSIGLMLSFFVLFGIFLALVASGQPGGATFFSNPLLSIPMLLAAGSAIIGGVMAAVAIFARNERSLLVFLVLLMGLFVLIFVLGELFQTY